MRKYPTPWQYLVDIVAQGRLKAAYASGDRKVRDLTDKNFRGLNEDEVVFEAVPGVRKDGKLAYSMTCKVRGFKIAELQFATGSLAKMVMRNANLMGTHEDLNTSQITGFYFCEDADQLHLLVHPNSNIHEALKMTGYEFEPQHYNVQAYAERDEVLLADGVVTVKHPVVAGEIYVSYVQNAGKSLEQELEEAGHGNPTAREGLENLTVNSKHYTLDKTPVTDPDQGGQIGYAAPEGGEPVVIPPVVTSAQPPVAEESTSDTTESETAPKEQETEEAPAVNIQQKKKK